MGLSVVHICPAQITYCILPFSALKNTKLDRFHISTPHKNCSLGETDFIIVNTDFLDECSANEES